MDKIPLNTTSSAPATLTTHKPHNAQNLNESLKVIQLLEQLRLSSIRGNLEGVKDAIEKGVSVNQTLKGGWSPLMFACSMGHPDVVEYLLKKEADADFHKERFTALMAACASTSENEDKLVKCVDLLAKYNADVNATERHHISALMFAAKEGHAKIVSKLISCNCTLDVQDGQGWTALFWAVNQGKVKVVETLVKAGAKIDVKDRRGQTAIDLAFSRGLDEILKIFNNKDKLPELTEHEEEQQQIALSSDKKFNDMYENMIVELDRNKIIENRFEKDSPGMLVSIEKVNGVCLKQNGYNYLKKDTRSKGQSKNIEKFKRDRNCKRVISKASDDEPIPWNSPYSLGDAVLLMKTTMKHLGVLYAGTSYIRLRLQGRQVDFPVEKKYSSAAGLASMTEKALQQTQILQEELKFLHQHVKKLEETDEIVAADIVVQRRGHKYRRLTTIILVTFAAVLIYNNRTSLEKIINY